MFNVSLFMVNTWTCIFFQTKREGLKGEEIQKHGKGRNNKKSKPQVLLLKWISVGIIFTISQLHWAWAWELPYALFPSPTSQTTASHMWWWHTPVIPVLRGLNRSLSDMRFCIKQQSPECGSCRLEVVPFWHAHGFYPSIAKTSSQCVISATP